MSPQLNLHTETIGRVYLTEPICVTPETTVGEAFTLMNARDRGSVLICRDGVLAGIFTEHDALVLMADGVDLGIPISQVMTGAPVSLTADDTVATAIRTMAQGGYRRLPIVDADGRPTGILKVNSVLHVLIDQFPATVHNLPPKADHSTETREGA